MNTVTLTTTDQKQSFDKNFIYTGDGTAVLTAQDVKAFRQADDSASFYTTPGGSKIGLTRKARKGDGPFDHGDEVRYEVPVATAYFETYNEADRAAGFNYGFESMGVIKPTINATFATIAAFVREGDALHLRWMVNGWGTDKTREFGIVVDSLHLEIKRKTPSGKTHNYAFLIAVQPCDVQSMARMVRVQHTQYSLR